MNKWIQQNGKQITEEIEICDSCLIVKIDDVVYAISDIASMLTATINQ
jgi:hypothetical protein